MGQASSFAFDAVERSIQRYLEENNNELFFEFKSKNDMNNNSINYMESIKRTDLLYFTLNDLRVVATFLPECLSSIDLHHLFLLFVVDNDRDGLFSTGDLFYFITWAIETIPVETNLDEVTEILRGRTVLYCWYICHIESQKLKREKNSNMRIKIRENQESDDNEASAYFVNWVQKLLYFSDTKKISSSVILPPLPSVPVSNEITNVREDEFFGVSDEKIYMARIKTSKAEINSSYMDNSTRDMNYSHTSTQDFPLITVNNSTQVSSQKDYHLFPLTKEKNKKKYKGVNGLSSLNKLGIQAIEELYKDLSVKELYGLSFKGFCQLLHPYNAVDLNQVGSINKDLQSVRSTRNQDEGNQEISFEKSIIIEPKTSSFFFVPVEVVEEFLICFCNSYWNNLRRLGLEPYNRV